jgi:DNA-binding NtrC family response regulator
MKAMFQYLESVAACSDQPVLVTGETGVGKELVARAVHTLSGRTGKFVPVNVAGLDDQVFSDTLFGHRKGAFTGADQAREGLIAQAAEGTLFLDEVGDLNPASQIKLLRLLQEQEYYPLGSDVAKRSRARIVAASNCDLVSCIEAGSFRRDLYYRLCTHSCPIPALRDRIEDIPLLMEHFVLQAATAQGKQTPHYSAALLALLKSYRFPGNIRELQAMVYDAVARHQDGTLSIELFREKNGLEPIVDSTCMAEAVQEDESDSITLRFSGFPTLKDVENELIQRALQHANGKQGAAAALLGLTRQALNNRLIRAR